MKNEHILNKNQSVAIIPLESIPTIELYVDQVTTFLEKRLAPNKRYEDDKIMTKTMINNYAKAKLFPSPYKKKYSKSHIILLILIYHLKSVLTIHDICKLFAPINKLLESNLECPELDKLYQLFTEMQVCISEHREYPLNPEEHSKIPYNILTVLSYSLMANRARQVAERVIDTNF